MTWVICTLTVSLAFFVGMYFGYCAGRNGTPDEEEVSK